MPALVLFDRKWKVGSDDLVFPALAEGLIRSVWLLLAAVLWSVEYDAICSCDYGATLNVYLSGLVTVLICGVVISISLAIHSMRGSIMQVEYRESVPTMAYARFVLGISEFAWLMAGSIVVFNDALQCPESETAVRTVRALLVLHWTAQTVILFAIVAVFDAGANSKYDMTYAQNSQADHKSVSHRFRQWCRSWWCHCCAAGNHMNVREAFADSACIMTGLFHNVDLVVTDIAAGLVLLYIRRKNKKNLTSRSTTCEFPAGSSSELPSGMQSGVQSAGPSQTNFHSVVFTDCDLNGEENLAEFTVNIPWLRNSLYELNPTLNRSPFPREWMNPMTALIYMKYALGCYGWMWYVYHGLENERCMFASSFPCFSERRSSGIKFTGDNCCLWNWAALKKITNLEDKDIIYASFDNDSLQTPFYVAIDHETSSVIVAIRGTLSLKDTLSKLNSISEYISVDGLPRHWMAHKNQLDAARFVMEKLDNLQILRLAFTDYPAYNLVITGHSLGAGAAVLLSLMLKHRRPDLRCIAFSPPGGLLGSEAARYSENFVMSVVIGKDIVSRLSPRTIEMLKCELIGELNKCTYSKYRLLLHGLWQAVVGSCCPPRAVNCFLNDKPSIDIRSIFSNLPFGSSASHSETLFLPGRILHLMEQNSFNSVTKLEEIVFIQRWAKKEDFNQVLITPEMLTDHIPDTLVRILRGLCVQLSRESSLLQFRDSPFGNDWTILL